MVLFSHISQSGLLLHVIYYFCLTVLLLFSSNSFIFRKLLPANNIITSVCLYSSSEIPQYRLPFDAVNFEVELMKDLGVKVQW